MNARVTMAGSWRGGDYDWSRSDSTRRRNWDGGSVGSVDSMSRV